MIMAGRNLAAATLLLAMLIASTASSQRGHKRQAKARKNKQRPNIIFILADDLDRELGSMSVMNKTRKLLQHEGAEFVNAYVTTPMCCPSRSSILTGMYVHNHNVLTNNLNCSSLSWRKGPERRNFGRFIHEAGYNTGYFGKYLNEYDGTWIPAGWREWVGLVRNSKFYNYTLRRNRAFERHGNNYHRDYLTDLITNNSISFFRRAKRKRPRQPVMMVLSMPAPHGPEDAAPQHKDMFPNITSPRTPHWNVHSSNKHWIIRQNPPMTAQKIAYTDLLHRKRLLTLLPVDNAVERVVHMLQDMRLENNTYVIFTSDHGYHLGQYRLLKGKSMPYEMDIKVPFYIRGPGIPRNIKMNEIVLNIDLAPSMLDMAGVRPPRSMDGMSIMKLFRKMSKRRVHTKKRIPFIWRDTFLVQRGKMKRETWKNVVSGKKTPAGEKFSKKGWKKWRVLGNLCSKSAYSSPCKPGQLWECIKVAGRDRRRKCKKRNLPTPPLVRKKCVCYRLKSPVMKPDPKANKIRRVEDSSKWPNDFPNMRRKRGRVKGKRKALAKSDVTTRRFYKELARAARRHNQSRKQALKRINTPVSETGALANQLEQKLEKLNGKIAGIKLKLQQMRDRKKKLMRIHMQALSFKEKYEAFPCECSQEKGRDRKPGKTREKRDRGQETEASPWKSDRKRANDGFKEQLQKRVKLKLQKKKKKKKKNKKCAQVGMTCFHHTENHWKTEPRWTKGEFCACPNAANNTYHCLRTINATHNFLYCEFVTEFLEYFDLNADPYQLYNIVHTISRDVLNELHGLLEKMKWCKGSRDCSHYYGKQYPTAAVTTTASPPVTTPRPTTVLATSTSSVSSYYNSTTLKPTVSTVFTFHTEPRKTKRQKKRKRTRRPTESQSSKKTPSSSTGDSQPHTPNKKSRQNKKRKSRLRRKKINRKKGWKTLNRKKEQIQVGQTVELPTVSATTPQKQY